MFRAVPGKSPGEHFPSLRDKLAETIGVFVIYEGHLPFAEFTIFLDVYFTSLGSLGFFEAVSHACHQDLLVSYRLRR